MQKIILNKQIKWLFDSDLQNLLEIFSNKNEEARVVGGAIRNALFGKLIKDIDIATTMMPNKIIKTIENLNCKIIKTKISIKFGTITLTINNKNYDIASLRSDNYKNHHLMNVFFHRNWEIDSLRRDFTINALYLDRYGTLYDYVQGLQDIKNRTIRFIGLSENRIREDCSRILRLFHFYALIPNSSIDDKGFQAIQNLNFKLKSLSGNKVWIELKKILLCYDPFNSLFMMYENKILSLILPEIENWNFDAIYFLIKMEQKLSWTPDPIFRFANIIGSNIQKINKIINRLNISKNEKNRLIKLSKNQKFSIQVSKEELRRKIYYDGRQSVIDRLRYTFLLDYRNLQKKIYYYRKIDNFVRNCEIPIFSLRGKDII